MTAVELLAAMDLTTAEGMLVAADRLEDEGHVVEAEAQRLAASVIRRCGQYLHDGASVYTATSAATRKGYDAKVACRIFARYPTARVVIVTHHAPTTIGLAYTAGVSRGFDTAAVVCYRKSSGGQWSRPAQTSGVRLANI